MSTPTMEDRASQSFEAESTAAKDVAIEMVGEKSHDWARAKSACSLVHPGPFISECDKKRGAADAERTRNERGRDSELRDPLVSCAEPVPTSTALVLFLTTCLSLMTAPLVEPRYFILPWVMWRLLVMAMLVGRWIITGGCWLCSPRGCAVRNCILGGYFGRIARDNLPNMGKIPCGTGVPGSLP